LSSEFDCFKLSTKSTIIGNATKYNIFTACKTYLRSLSSITMNKILHCRSIYQCNCDRKQYG
jgi:hypothetical protein